MSLRVFFSIPLKPALTHRLVDHADSLSVRDSAGEVLWTSEDSYHLTLCFVGEVALEHVSVLEQIAREVLAEQPVLPLKLAGTTRLQVNAQLDVVAVLCEPVERLGAVRAALISRLRAEGIGIREVAFKPHVTLGRMTPEAAFQLPDMITPLELPFCADRVTLLQSRPGERGSLYSPLFDIDLADEPLNIAAVAAL